MSPLAFSPDPSSAGPEPFFRVTVKNEERGQEGASCLSKVSVTLSETTITLLKGRHTLVRPSSAQPPAAAAVASSAQLLQSVPRGAEEVTSVAWGCESQLGGVLLDPRICLISSLGPPSPPSRLGVSESPSRPYLLKASS